LISSRVASGQAGCLQAHSCRKHNKSAGGAGGFCQADFQ
jgi:hypothetical protein